MKRSLVLSSICMVFCVVACGEDPKPLFDGKTLDGWKQLGGKATYSVENGEIVGRSVPNSPNSFLCTEKHYADFALELELKVDPKLNSGIQIRSHSIPEYRNGVVHGYQVEVDPTDRAFSGGIYDEQRRGWLQDLSKNEPGRKAFRNTEWNHYKIEAIGDSIKTWVNGIPTADMHDDMTSSGFIALQVHAHPSTTPLEVRWRNIMIEEIDNSEAAMERSRKIQGDYASKTEPGSPFAQVIALGRGRYQANILAKPDTRDPAIAVLEGKEEGDKVVFAAKSDTSAVIENGVMTIDLSGAPRPIKIEKAERKSPTLGAKPPLGATVCFDGSSLDKWQAIDGQPVQWKLTDDGAMEVTRKSKSIETKDKFADGKIHLEFKTPFMPNHRGQGRGNSGVYVQGAYEVQILDSYGLSGEDNECGGIYKVGKPRVNMCFPPGQWQTYDIEFTAAKFDAAGNKTSTARISVDHNGVRIHDNTELPNATAGGKSKDEPKEPAGIMLQDHGNPVQFRNIWVAPR